MEINVECMYCGKKWTQHYYSGSGEIRCSACGDKNVRVRKPEESGKIDQYIGCPPFPEKKDKYWRLE